MTAPETSRRRSLHFVLPVALTFVGLALLTMKVVADSEPGAIPLLMIAAGVTWLVLARRRA